MLIIRWERTLRGEFKKEQADGLFFYWNFGLPLPLAGRVGVGEGMEPRNSRTSEQRKLTLLHLLPQGGGYSSLSYEERDGVRCRGWNLGIPELRNFGYSEVPNFRSSEVPSKAQ